MENLFKNNNCKVIFEFTPDFYKNLSSDYEQYCISFLDFLKEYNLKIYIVQKINYLKLRITIFSSEV